MTQKLLTDVSEESTLGDSFELIGMQLKSARNERGIRLFDAARELRISNDYLKFLECGDFDQLPAPIYVSGFLRSYSKFLGLDGDELAGRYYALLDGITSKMDYKLPAAAGPPQRSTPAVASFCVALALLGYGGWYWVSGPKSPDATVQSELAVVELDNKLPVMMEKNAINEAFENSAGGTRGGESASDLGTSMTSRTDIEPVEVVKTDSKLSEAGGNSKTVAAFEAEARTIVDGGSTESSNSAETLNIATETGLNNQQGNEVLPRETSFQGMINDGTVAQGLEQQLEPGQWAAVATLRVPDQEVTIRATASSWVEVVRGDGTSIMKKLMKAGEIFVVDDGSQLYLSTGNAGGIELVTGDNETIIIGTVGEIIRDLPLAKNRLRDRF